jgi:hypothetical protein
VMHSQHADQQLGQLADRFDQWCECRKTSRERIPQPLWEQAVSLTSVLPVSRVAKRLRLCISDLKKRCSNRSMTTSVQASTEAVSFVEVTPPPSWLPASVNIDIQRLDGTRMHIAYQQQAAPLAALVRAFVEAS